MYGLSKTTFGSGPGVRSGHGAHYQDFKAKSLKAAKAHVEKVAIAEERTQFEGTPNPYMGDAVSGAKQRKYGYPKPPKPKKNPSKGSQKMTRASSNPSKEQHQRYAQQSWAQARLTFREAVEEAAKYEDDRTSRRLMVALRAATATIKEATRTFWNAYDAGDWERAGKAAILVAEAEDIIAYITESESWAPVKMTGPETAYRVFDVRIPASNPRHTAERAAKRDKHKRKKGKKGSMTPYARKRAGGGARKNPGTKKSLAAIMREM